MSEVNKTAAKKIPKGGRKGGTTFPRLGLADALTYSKRLVSKTHNGPQPVQTVLVGVFNNKGPLGGVRASALKQYGLLQGDSHGYEASPLAKKIEAAVPEERAPLVQQAFLTPKIFKQIYETLQSETASRARVRQAVLTGDVHLDSADKCAQIFIDGAVHSGLGAMDGDSVALGNLTATTSDVESTEVDDEAQNENTDRSEQIDDGSHAGLETEETDVELPTDDATNGAQPARPAKAGVNLNLNVDSSSDPEKLEKQLKLLKRFGLL